MPLPEIDRELAKEVLRDGVRSSLREETLHVAAPLLDRGGVATGVAIINLPRDELDELLRSYVRNGLLAGVLAFAIGSMIALFSARRIAQPVMALTDAAMAMEQRAFDPDSLTSIGRRRDELGTLIRVFQEMARVVQARQEQLEALVRERTLDLQVKNEQLEEARRRTDEELQIAHMLQGAILPREIPDQIAFSGGVLMNPARELGGDFYDFFILPDGRLGVLIADVSGKGVPAAFFMAIARTVVRSMAFEYPNPGDCLREANNVICETNPHLLFVTLFYAVLDPATGNVAYANAGHNPPYLIRDGGAVLPVPMTGDLVIGVMPDSPYREGSLTLAPGDRLFLFTDGISEAMNEAGEIFGEDRIERTLAETQTLPIESLVDRITVNVSRFAGTAEQSDDITCVALRYNGRPEMEDAA